MQEESFYRYLANTPNINKSAFENNWPYILQATRNGLKIFEKDGAVIYCTKRIKGDSLSPNVIINHLGIDNENLVTSFTNSELKKGVHTIIKNVSIKDVSQWANFGFKETIEPWSKYSYRDDNTFPQYNIERQTVESINFGNDVNSQIRKFNRTRKIFTSEYDPSFNDEAKKLLNNFSEYSEKKGNDYAHEVRDGHLFFFDTNIKRKIRLQHIENGELIGFSFLTPVGNICFYNAVICKKERNLMKYLVYQAMNFVCVNYPNIKIFGMQGSENAGQDYLKRRLKPCEIIKKTHIIN